MKIIRPLDDSDRERYNKIVSHPLQTWEWGTFRKETGVDVERFGIFDGSTLVDGFQITFHALPKLPYVVGYVPKGKMPDEQQIKALIELGRKKRALFIKLEPNIAFPVVKEHQCTKEQHFLLDNGMVLGRPLFTQYSFFLDISHSEQELLDNMKPKTRYNIHLAERKGVEIVEDSSEQGLTEYLEILHQTTSRQKFYAHGEVYFRKMWDVLEQSGMVKIFKAMYQGKTLVVWIAFIHNNVLYYPYGASSNEYRELMASNLMMWRFIQYGKQVGCTLFDMWGSLGPDAQRNDPWYGFHHFKEGFGGQQMECIGSYDLVMNPRLYSLFRMVEKFRWKFLRLRLNM